MRAERILFRCNACLLAIQLQLLLLAPLLGNTSAFAPSMKSDIFMVLPKRIRMEPLHIQSKTTSENPLWPNGVATEDIRELVDDIIADPSINIPGLPDVLERQIYKTTTVLTYNAVYRLVGWVHNKPLLGHTFEVTRLRRDKDRYARARQKSLLHMKTDVDEELLEDIADQLLSNAAINQPLIPDAIERQLYMNCLKIIFRILNMLAASFRITICGHDLTLNLNKAMDRNRDTVMHVARTATSSKTPIDTTILQDLVRSHRYDEVFRETDRDTENDIHGWEEKAGSSIPAWKKGLKGTQEEFVVQINTVLYSLILGIIDDLLANTELVLMTDRIHFDIIPPSSAPINTSKSRNPAGITIVSKTDETRLQGKETVTVAKGASKRRKLRMVLTFLLGTVFGMATRSAF